MEETREDGGGRAPDFKINKKSVKLSVWLNESEEKSPQYTVTRIFKTGEEWHETRSLFVQDSEDLREALDDLDAELEKRGVKK